MACRWTPEAGTAGAHFCDIAQEAIPVEMVPGQRFNLPGVCALASIGDDLKQRFQFAVLLYKLEPRKQLQTRLSVSLLCLQCVLCRATLGIRG